MASRWFFFGPAAGRPDGGQTVMVTVRVEWPSIQASNRARNGRRDRATHRPPPALSRTDFNRLAFRANRRESDAAPSPPYPAAPAGSGDRESWPVRSAPPPLPACLRPVRPRLTNQAPRLTLSFSAFPGLPGQVCCASAMSPKVFRPNNHSGLNCRKSCRQNSAC